MVNEPSVSDSLVYCIIIISSSSSSSSSSKRGNCYKNSFPIV